MSLFYLHPHLSPLDFQPACYQCFLEKINQWKPQGCQEARAVKATLQTQQMSGSAEETHLNTHRLAECYKRVGS